MGRLTLAVAVIVVAAPSMGRADPTTIGVEWEVRHQWIDLTEIAGLARADEVNDLKTGKPLGTRLLCSTERSVVDPSWPLFNLTYDLRSKNSSRHIRQLEVVTGPMFHVGDDNPPGLERAGELLDTFYKAFEASCANREVVLDGIKVCPVTVAELVETMPGATTKCHQVADEDLTPEQAAKITVLIPRQLDAGQDGAPSPLGSLRAVIEAGLLRVNTQASAGFALALYGQPKHDLGELYERRKKSHGKDAEGPSLAWLAYEHFRVSKAEKLGALDDEQRGFLALYYIGLHVRNAYFLDQYALKGKSADFKDWVGQYRIVDDDWPLKHAFGVLPKHSLASIYKLLDARKKFPPSAFSPSGDNVAFFCDAAFATRVNFSQQQVSAIGPGELGSLHHDQLEATCKTLYAGWETMVTNGVDPFALDVLANEIASKPGDDGQLRVIFEMRRPNAIVYGLSPFYMFKKITFNWDGLPKALPRKKE